MSRRNAKTVYRYDGSSWVLTKDLRFVYDAWNMIAELDHTFATGTGTGLAGSKVLRTYLWGVDLSGTMTGAGGVGGLLSFTNHLDGTTYHVCSDAIGNVTGLVPANGPDAGKLIARYDYGPFGNRITNTGPDVELCPFGFSTKYTDSETSLVYCGYRYYSLELGRWPSRDLIGEQGGINIYGFVGNDSVNRWDYLGMFPNETDVDREILDYSLSAGKSLFANMMNDVAPITIKSQRWLWIGSFSYVQNPIHRPLRF